MPPTVAKRVQSATKKFVAIVHGYIRDHSNSEMNIGSRTRKQILEFEECSSYASLDVVREDSWLRRMLCLEIVGCRCHRGYRIPPGPTFKVWRRGCPPQTVRFRTATEKIFPTLPVLAPTSFLFQRNRALKVDPGGVR